MQQYAIERVYICSGATAARSGAPYLYSKLTETHELIFSWSSWLAVLWARTHDGVDDGGVAQDGGHPPNNRLTETCSLGLPCTFLIYDIML